MVERSGSEETTKVEEKDRQPVFRMVPFFGRRSIIAVAIGLIVGAGLGLGYWIISPSFSLSIGQAKEELIEPTEPTDDLPWASKVSIQLVNPGYSYMSMRELRGQVEYYAAKANSLPFLKFLSQELDEQAPEYSHTVDELNSIIRVRFISNELDEFSKPADYESENPVIEIKVTSPSYQEALFLAEFVPRAFRSHLITEEEDKKKQEYQNSLEEIENLKVVLYEAEKELDALQPQDILNNPEHIALSARIEVLERELSNKVVQLTTSITMGDDIQREYEETLQKVKSVGAALIEAEQVLSNLEDEEDSTDIRYNDRYIMLTAKVDALEYELERLMNGYEDSDNDVWVTGLAEMIANGVTRGLDYTDRLEEIETASAALVEARKELSKLENQSGTNSPTNLDYRLAQINVDILSSELFTLQERLALLAPARVIEEDPADTQSDINKIATALSQSRNELATLENQSGYDRLAMELDYKVAQEKVDNLNSRLRDLNEQLGSLIGGITESQEIGDYLAVGSPSMPTPVLPERIRLRNALMIGAILGISVAWTVLNYRWIIKGMPPTSTVSRNEDEEE